MSFLFAHIYEINPACRPLPRHVSGGMMDQDGTIIGSNFKRLNV